MAHYAVMNGDVVENVIAADTLEVAETVTGKECIEFCKEHPAGIDWTYNRTKKVFSAPQPWPSWTFDEEKNYWVPPILPPETGLYDWDEESLSWKEVL